jgi:PAS domain S-box-containing protein
MSLSDRLQPKKGGKDRQHAKGLPQSTRPGTRNKPSTAASRAHPAKSNRELNRAVGSRQKTVKPTIAEAVMRNMGEGLYTVDRQGLVTSMNPVAERLFGWKLDELRGRKMHEYTHNKHRDGTPFPAEECAGLQVLQQGKSLVDFEDVFIRKDGTFFDVTYSSSALRERGRITGLVVVFRDVTEHKRANLRLRASEDSLKAMFDAAYDAVLVLDQDWRLISANSMSEQLYGLPLSELLKGSLSDLRAPQARSTVDSDMQRSLLEGGVRLETVHQRKNGSQFKAEVSCKPFRSGDQNRFVLIVRDVTDRKIAEEALRHSEERYRSLTRILTSVVWTMDANGAFASAQPEWEEFTGQTWEECRGEGWIAALHPADRERVYDAWRESLTNRTIFKSEGRFRHAESGEYHSCLAQAVPLFNADGSIREWIGNIHDVHQQRQAEDERERLLVAERQAREEADSASRAKDEFLATVSHELRSPLNAILGWSRLLASGTLSDENASRGLKAIERNARSQAQLVEDLLDVSRIDTGKFRLNSEAVNLVHVIEAAVDSIRPAADLKSVRLQVALDLDAGAIEGDAERLQQVVWNLLSNAVKFTPADGSVQVMLARFDSYVEIIVSDTGQGIDPSFLPFVFDRFRQADGSITRSFGGLGLGLAIVRHVTELHGGSVTADSKGRDQGSSFTVRIPVKAEREIRQSRPASGADDSLTPPKSLKDVRILIVDDQPETLSLFQTVLAQSGARVRTAASAEEGFNTVRAWLPQLIVSDIGMPEEDGYSFMNRVRVWARGAGVWIPAVALTGYAQAEDRLKVLAAGFQTHLSKPVDPAELIAVLVNLIDR